MWMQEPIYDLTSIYDLYNRKLTNWQYLGSSGGYEMKINNRRMVAVPFTKSISNNTRRKRGGERGKSEETKLKISKSNKGKRLGYAPWNKGKKLSYITGKREHTEETRKKMSEAAKRRWAQAQRRNENMLTY
jgi:NUMOD3 motif